MTATRRSSLDGSHRRVSAVRFLALLPCCLLSACLTLTAPDAAPSPPDGPVTVAADPAPSPPPSRAPSPPPAAAHRGSQRPYTVRGVTYHPQADSRGYSAVGTASWYGQAFHGRRTATGEPFDMHALTAAHKTLPLPSYVLVRNLANQRSALVKVNDRGPFVGDRLIDLSYAAAQHLGLHQRGLGAVEVVAVPAPEPASAGAATPADVPWVEPVPARRTAQTRRYRAPDA